MCDFCYQNTKVGPKKNPIFNFSYVFPFTKLFSGPWKDFLCRNTVKRFSAGQEIACILCCWKVITVLTRIHHLFQFRPTLNPVDTHPSSFLKIYFNKILPSVPPSSKWSLYFMYRYKNSICISVLPLVCHMHYPSHSPLFDHPNNIWQGIQSMISLFYPSKV